MFCPNCGTDNKEGSIYCNLCQEPLERYAPSPPQVTEAPLSPPVAGAAPQNALVPPGAGFGQAGPPPPPYGSTAYAGGGGMAAMQPPFYPGQQGYMNYNSPYPMVVAQAPSAPGEATAALVLGIIGLVLGCFVLPIICSILAIVFGIKARNMIDASGGFLGGRGMATAGLTLGIIGMALWTVLNILSFALQWYDASSILTCPAAFSMFIPSFL